MRLRPGRIKTGFTTIELVAVIVLLGILAAIALPRYSSATTQARIAALEGIAGTMRTTISLTKMKAKLAGLDAISSNPNAGQSAYIIDTELGQSEVDFRNLCPESSAELGDALDMADHMKLSLTADLTIATDNQFTRIGFDVSNSLSSGCYVLYDSFGNPDCTVELVTTDC